MVDVHDRRPVALPEDLAVRWLDQDLNQANAVELLQHGLPETEFTWHAFRPAIGTSKYQLPDAIDPIKLGPMVDLAG